LAFLISWIVSIGGISELGVYYTPKNTPEKAAKARYNGITPAIPVAYLSD
jgi:hypothetical protein